MLLFNSFSAGIEPRVSRMKRLYSIIKRQPGSTCCLNKPKAEQTPLNYFTGKHQLANHTITGGVQYLLYLVRTQSRKDRNTHERQQYRFPSTFCCTAGTEPPLGGNSRHLSWCRVWQHVPNSPRPLAGLLRLALLFCPRLWWQESSRSSAHLCQITGVSCWTLWLPELSVLEFWPPLPFLNFQPSLFMTSAMIILPDHFKASFILEKFKFLGRAPMITESEHRPLMGFLQGGLHTRLTGQLQ